MCRSSQSFNILSGNPLGIWTFEDWFDKIPTPFSSLEAKLCSNGPPKSWIDDPFFCKIQNQGRSSEPLPRESKLFTFKHVHFQDEALVFHRKDFTLPVQNFIPARQSSNCPIPFPPGTFDNQMPGKMLRLWIDRRITDFCRNPWFQQFFFTKWLCFY